MFSATMESSKRSNLATRSSFVNNIPWTLPLFIYTPSVGFKQERFPMKGRDSLMFIETPSRSYRYFVNFFMEVLIRISGNKQYFELFILILESFFLLSRAFCLEFLRQIISYRQIISGKCAVSSSCMENLS